MLYPEQIGALAACGVSEVAVLQKPRVGVLSTGGELLDIDGEPKPGCVYDINSHTLSCALRMFGCEVVSLGKVSDEPAALKSAITDGIKRCDLLILSGGSSLGEGDVVVGVLSELGRLLFHGIAVKPGKPTVLALVKGRPLVGLPGNPTSAMAVFHVLVRPLVDAMLGARGVTSLTVRAVAGCRIHSVKGRRELKFVRLERSERGLVAHPISTGSEAASTYALSDGYVDIPEEVEMIEEGEEVEVKLLS
mgnify:CR=1 FL=1